MEEVSCIPYWAVYPAENSSACNDIGVNDQSAFCSYNSILGLHDQQNRLRDHGSKLTECLYASSIVHTDHHK